MNEDFLKILGIIVVVGFLIYLAAKSLRLHRNMLEGFTASDGSASSPNGEAGNSKKYADTIKEHVIKMQGGLPPTSTTAKNASNQLPLSSLQNPNPTLLVDATRDDPPYNTNSVPAYDASSYYVGTTTPLDAMNQAQENLLHSPDPMSDNWGGADYTQKLVDSGYYKGNEVSILVQ